MSDLFLGFCIGFVVCGVLSFILECLCIASGNSDIEKWTEEDK